MRWIEGVFLSLFAGGCVTSCVTGPVLPVGETKALPKTLLAAEIKTAFGCGTTVPQAWRDSVTKLLAQLSPTGSPGQASVSPDLTNFVLANGAALGVQGTVTMVQKNPQKGGPKSLVCATTQTMKSVLRTHATTLGFRYRLLLSQEFFQTPATSVGLWRNVLAENQILDNIAAAGQILALLGATDPNSVFLSVARYTINKQEETLTFSYSPTTPYRVRKYLTPLLVKLRLSLRQDGAATTFVVSALYRKRPAGGVGSLVLQSAPDKQNLVVWGGPVSSRKNMAKTFLALVEDRLFGGAARSRT